MPSVQRVQEILEDEEVESASSQTANSSSLSSSQDGDLKKSKKKEKEGSAIEMEHLLLPDGENSDAEEIYSPQQRAADLLSVKPIAVKLKAATFTWEKV